MKFTDRLKDTIYENDMRAWIVCCYLEFCQKRGCASPTESEWGHILGCFPKGKARHGQEKKNEWPRSQVRKLIDGMTAADILSVTKGHGNKRNSFEIPEGKNLLADKIENYNNRYLEWKTKVWIELKPYVDSGEATLEDVKQFFETYSSPDEEYRMLWENEKEKSKHGHFYIRQRFVSWKKRRDGVLKKAVPVTEVQTGELFKGSAVEQKEKEDGLLTEWMRIKGVTEYDYATMHEEFERWKSINQ